MISTFKTVQHTTLEKYLKFTDIADVLTNPVSLPKVSAPCFAMHALKTKKKGAIRLANSMRMLSIDIDSGNLKLSAVSEMAEHLKTQCYIYSTASSMRYAPEKVNKNGEITPARVHGKRWRILIPLADPVFCDLWEYCQNKLIDIFSADDCAARIQQIMFAPNNPALIQHPDPLSDQQEQHYEYHIIDGELFTPPHDWVESCASEKQDRVELATKINTAMISRANNVQEGEFNIQTAEQALPAEMDTTSRLISYGYIQRGTRFISPSSSSGTAGVIVFDDGRWYSHHGSDSGVIGLDCEGGGTCGDQFDLYTYYEHGGDQSAALKTLANQCDPDGQKARQREYAEAKNAGSPTPPDTPHDAYNATLDDEQAYSQVNLLRHLPDCLIKRLSIDIAKAIHMPPSTVFLAGLGVFASMAARKYVVNYPENHKVLPLGIYAVLEQPSGTGKSRCLNYFQTPFWNIQREARSDINAKLNRLDDKADKDKVDEFTEDLKPVHAYGFVTNATPEAVEQGLNNSKGFFSSVSSEQGLFDSMLGGSYGGDRASNNDVLLNGFDGGHISSARVGRTGYIGNVIGGVVCFAQNGSVEKVLEAAKGKGLSGRFLMLSEPHFLGTRDHMVSHSVDGDSLAKYDNVCIGISQQIVDHGWEKDELMGLSISPNGFDLINRFKNKCEPHLADGGRYSHISIREAVGKANMQIMKLAANLHLINGHEYGATIPDNLVIAAINIVEELLEANLEMCKQKGIIGNKAEFDSILKVFDKGRTAVPLRDIIRVRTKSLPFRDYTGNRSVKVRFALENMVAQKLLKITYTPEGSELYSLF